MARPASIRAQRPLALVLVAILIVGSAALAVVLALREQRSGERQERALARQVTAGLSRVIAETTAGLRGAGGLVEANGDISDESFAAYARAIHYQPGTLAVALERVVPGPDRARFERRLRRRITDLVVPGRFAPAPRRDVYYPVTAAQPDTPENQQLVGLDIGGDRLRGPTARRARDRGTPQLTPPLELTTTAEPGFIVIAPLYRPSAPIDSIQERRRALVGFVSAGYRADQVAAVAFAGLPEDARVSVVDDGTLLLGERAFAGGVSARLSPGGRIWSISVQRDGTDPYVLAGLVFGAGVLLAVLAWGLYAQARRRERALEDAREEERQARREAVAAEQRTSALQAITADLARCRTRVDVLTVALDRAGTSFVPDYALAGLVEGNGQRLRVTGSAGVAGATEGTIVGLETPLSLRTAVATGAPVWFHAADQWPEALPPALAPEAELGFGVCLPLHGASAPLGLLVLGLASWRGWEPADRALVEAMAGQVGLALERASLEEQGRELVATLQRTLLPADLPPHKDLDLAACYEPAASGLEIGGDWYDAVELPDGRLALVVGDVVGHGPAAAAVMGQLRSALRAFALERRDPAAALGLLAQFAADPTYATGATAVCVIIDPATGAFDYARAGHPPLLVVRDGGRAEVLDEARGIPLGVFVDPGYENAHGSLGPGDTLVLYSDGAVERRGESIDTGIARLAALASTEAISARDVCDTVRDGLLADGAFADDVALVFARRRLVV